MKSRRIILDTNLWISFLISNKLSRIDGPLYKGKIRILFSQELLEEFIEVTSRPKFHKYFSFHDITNLLRLFDSYGELVTVTSRLKICRDSKDNFLLNLALDGKADFLVTGDNDLLGLGKVGKTKIVTIHEFLSIL